MDTELRIGDTKVNPVNKHENFPHRALISKKSGVKGCRAVKHLIYRRESGRLLEMTFKIRADEQVEVSR